MAGVPLPQGVVIRGRDLTPLLQGGRPDWNNDLFAEYKQYHFEQAEQYGYRTPEWKLVRDCSNPANDELYHLSADPDEHRNLIASEDPKVAAAKQSLQAKLEESRRSLEQQRAEMRRFPRGRCPNRRIHASRRNGRCFTLPRGIHCLSSILRLAVAESRGSL